MFPKLTAFSLLSLACATIALAEPPAGKGKPDKGGGGDGSPSSFDPEILYQYNGQLRFANLAGDQAVLVHENASLNGFDLSSDVSKRIVYTDGDLFLRTWQVADPESAFLSEPTQVTSGYRVVDPDFSPDDRRVVFTDGARGIFMVDLDTSDVVTFVTPIEAFYLRSPRWSPDGTSVVFYGGYEGDRALWRLDLTDLLDVSQSQRPTPKRIATQGVDFDDQFLDISRPKDGSDPVIAISSVGPEKRLALLKLDGSPAPVVQTVEGKIWGFNCDNTAVIHRDLSGRKAVISITQLSNGAREIWLRGDKAGTKTDWLPKADC
ncbi:TolB family protein [Sphingomicrobium clamense]|uniref:Uncharacterized protein n=1 Tax=Sphingomicrobium clamense TaxID=2851013 RepID=A0ABS6V7I8_9SPHN|nr:hypothetical protein [Sphingomicrobium sp. B8]MBW0145543.1 hypothetical protein [Sphingomicrobium sp. B8]